MRREKTYSLTAKQLNDIIVRSRKIGITAESDKKKLARIYKQDPALKVLHKATLGFIDAIEKYERSAGRSITWDDISVKGVPYSAYLDI